jgi:hypothetical protein
VVKAAAGTLRNVTVRLDSTLASGTYYLQLWNLAALPADATVVGAGNSLDAPVKVVHTNGTDDLIVYDFAELGIPFTAGAVLSLERNTDEQGYRFTRITSVQARTFYGCR